MIACQGKLLKALALELKDFYNQSPIGICVVKRDRLNMRVAYANPALAHMLKPRSPQSGKKNLIHPDDLRGKLLADIWPHEDVLRLIKDLRSTLPPETFTLAVTDNTDKQERWVTLSITEDEFEDEPCFVLWATDISKSKDVENQLKEEVERADAAAEVKANFLATMSHEIRTPMQSVFGLLELMGEEKPEPNMKTMIETAKNSASGLLEILDDILDFAKMDADSMELDTFEVPVRTLVYGINEAMAVKVHAKNVALEDNIDKDVPFVIIGDPKRLRQIIMNLMSNALKFTEKGAVTIRVNQDIQHIEKPRHGLALRFEIVDTGIGMTQEAQDRLFKPFSQADSSTSRKYGGTGLGLSICKKLVELMGGQIGVSSEEGKGSTFWFEIPTEEVGTDSTTVKMPVLDGITVLSVEDHPQGAKEIVRSLDSMGATVESCATYAEGLALVKRRPFDVGIIDQGLPDGLGLDLIREIMDIRPFMGLVMYTVRDDLGLQHTLNTLGIKYLTKPASRIGLGEAVFDAAQKTKRLNIEGPKKLLIAEDTESVRDVLARQLNRLGVEADFVENGQQALEALKTGQYGIVFSDLHMPEIDGYELIKIIREEETISEKDKHFPVIVLTADVQMAQRQTYLSYGFDECLLKPVSLGQFQRLLIRWGLLEESPPAEQSQEPVTAKVTPPDKKAAKTDTEAAPLPPAIDLEAMKAQMGAVDEGAIEMMHMFTDMTQPLIDKLREQMDHKDYKELTETAHSLKGGARSACCGVLGDLAARLQDDAAEEDKGCATLVKAIEAEFKRVKEAVKDLKPL